MLNQVIIVGRLISIKKLKINEEKEEVIITIAVPRNYKNENGEYDTDFVDCTLWNGIAQNTVEYCSKGDAIGIRGRIQTNTIEKEDGIKENKMVIIAEKVTLLSTSKKEEKEEDGTTIICKQQEE